MGRRLGMIVLGCLVFGATGCPDDAPVPAPIPEPPPPPPPRLPFDETDQRLDVVSVAALPASDKDGGPAPDPVRLDAASLPLIVPPGAGLRVELWQRLTDFRVRFVDDHNKLVDFEVLRGEASARPWDRPGPGGTWVVVRPTRPLTDGDPYELIITGESGDAPAGADGKTFEDLTLPVQSAIVEEDPGTGGR